MSVCYPTALQRRKEALVVVVSAELGQFFTKKDRHTFANTTHSTDPHLFYWVFKGQWVFCQVYKSYKSSFILLRSIVY